MPKSKGPKEHTHPWVPADTPALFGTSLLWLEPGEPAKFDMPDGKYAKEYLGKVVVQQPMGKDDDPTLIPHPVYFDKGGTDYEFLTPFAVKGYLEYVETAQHCMEQRLEFEDKLNKANTSLKTAKSNLALKTNLVKEKSEQISELKEEIDGLQTELGLRAKEASGPSSLMDAVGGEPKEVNIKW